MGGSGKCKSSNDCNVSGTGIQKTLNYMLREKHTSMDHHRQEHIIMGSPQKKHMIMGPLQTNTYDQGIAAKKTCDHGVNTQNAYDHGLIIQRKSEQLNYSVVWTWKNELPALLGVDNNKKKQRLLQSNETKLWRVLERSTQVRRGHPRKP